MNEKLNTIMEANKLGGNMRRGEMTIQQYFESNAQGNELKLITCEGEEPTQFLGLSRKPDGRLDLVDLGCSDTGSDLRDCTIEELQQMAREWMGTILNSCSAEEKDELRAEILPQIAEI